MSKGILGSHYSGWTGGKKGPLVSAVGTDAGSPQAPHKNFKQINPRNVRGKKRK
jgi:hypothetical protein